IGEVGPAKTGRIILALRLATGQRAEPDEDRRDDASLSDDAGGAVPLYRKCRVHEDAVGPGLPLVGRGTKAQRTVAAAADVRQVRVKKANRAGAQPNWAGAIAADWLSPGSL